MIHNVLDFFFPSSLYCMACGNLINKERPYSLCQDCMENINWILGRACNICGKDLGKASLGKDICFECEEIEHDFTRGFSCSTYEGPVKEILSGLKYRGKAYYAEKMSHIMYDRSFGFIDEISIDLILPVPMSKKKEKKRGYNQAKLLSSGLAKKLNIRWDKTILIKKKDTLPMSGLDSAERRINLHNTFDIGYNKNRDVNGRSILLIDDVYTTGSTADACAEVLKKNNASNVYVYTFASGVNMKKREN